MFFYITIETGPSPPTHKKLVSLFIYLIQIIQMVICLARNHLSWDSLNIIILTPHQMITKSFSAAF